VTNAGSGLAVIFCGFISLLIGRETINIPEIFSGVHGFTGMTVIGLTEKPFCAMDNLVPRASFRLTSGRKTRALGASIFK